LIPNRRCPYCQQAFQPSPYRLQQRACSQAECQSRRRADYHRQKIRADPLYAQVVRDSRRQWQAEHAAYQKNYWQTHPEAAERNRTRQRQRDRLSLDQQTSNLFYQVISTRHSHKRSTIITTNTAFSEWGNILYNTTIATAIADRLVENSEIFLLGGDSVRKANKNPNPPDQ
jgi:IstB-like ATP binding protein